MDPSSKVGVQDITPDASDAEARRLKALARLGLPPESVYSTPKLVQIRRQEFEGASPDSRKSANADDV